MYYNLPLEQAKQILKNLQSDHKLIQKTGMRKFFSTEFVLLERTFEFCQLQTKNYYTKATEERLRAKEFSFSKAEAEKAGWYERNEKKVDKTKLLQWANQAYPNITEQLWDNEFEQAYLLDYIKKSSL